MLLWPRTHWQQSRPHRQQSWTYTATVDFVAGFGNSRLSTKSTVLNSTLSQVCTRFKEGTRRRRWGGVWWRGLNCRCGGGLDPSPEKIGFWPQNSKFGCIWTQFLTGRKHGQSLEALGHGFYGSVARQNLQKQCKNYQKIHHHTKGDSPSPPREYATDE